MSINDFYSPLNLKNLAIFVFLFVLFDSIGVAFNNRLLKSPKNYRPLYWIFGMTTFIFFWFLLSFFVVPNTRNVTLSLLGFSIVFLPPHTRSFKMHQVTSALRGLAVPLILILPLLPAIFVKASLPSYQWDELSYHYTSPWGYNHLTTRTLNDGFYENIPKNLDTMYSLVFSLTQTYSIARLFHFFIFFSAMYFSYTWIKKNYGLLSAGVFILVSFYIPGDLLPQATSGYVDIGSNSFVFLGILATIDLLKKKVDLSLPVAFWALALGTRYNSLIPFLTYASLTGLYLLFTRRLISTLRQQVFTSLTIFIVLGGFWYLKNLLYTGNPIFPFVLPCFRFASTCLAMKSYFGSGWTYPVDLQTLPMIIYYILSGSKSMAVALGASLFLITQLKSKSKFVPWFIVLAIIFDFVVIKYLSGYLPRYFIYLQTLCFLLVSIILGKNQFVSQKIVPIRLLLILALIAFLLKQVPLSTFRTYSFDMLNPHEINYALGKENVYDWTAFIFPETTNLIRWCDRTKIKGEIPITFYDPDITWYRYEGRFNAFLNKCAIVPTPTTIGDPELALKQLISDKQKFNLVSLNPCRTTPLEKWHPTETDSALNLRYINNKIVCNSQPTEIPGLYIFDWEKVSLSNAN